MHEETITKHQMQLNSGKHASWHGTPVWKTALNADLLAVCLQTEDTMTCEHNSIISFCTLGEVLTGSCALIKYTIFQTMENGSFNQPLLAE